MTPGTFPVIVFHKPCHLLNSKWHGFYLKTNNEGFMFILCPHITDYR